MRKLLLVISAVFALTGCGDNGYTYKQNTVDNEIIKQSRFETPTISKKNTHLSIPNWVDKDSFSICATEEFTNVYAERKTLNVGTYGECDYNKEYKKVASEFTNNIYPKLIALWGNDWDNIDKGYLVNGRNINIIFVDTLPKNMAGLVLKVNLFKYVYVAMNNEGLTIYINKNYLKYGINLNKVYSVIAHEFTHIIYLNKNWMNNNFIQNQNRWYFELLAKMSEELLGYSDVDIAKFNEGYYKDFIIDYSNANSYRNMRVFARWLLQKHYSKDFFKKLIDSPQKSEWAILEGITGTNMKKSVYNFIKDCINNDFSYKEIVVDDYVFELKEYNFDLEPKDIDLSNLINTTVYRGSR
jgi:hypothetical protein